MTNQIQLFYVIRRGNNLIDMSSHKGFRMQYLEGNGNNFHIAAERFRQ